ncbi:MAG: hypothetical protein U1D55_02375 [Phycisphaerae bacterium]
MTINARGRGWFRAGAITLILFGLVHLLAVYNALWGQPRNEHEIVIRREAQAYREKLGPFEPSAWGAMQILNSSYSVLLLFAGCLDLAALSIARGPAELRRFAMLSAIFMVLVAAIALAFQFPPPAVFAMLALVFFGLSYRAMRGEPAAPH